MAYLGICPSLVKKMPVHGGENNVIAITTSIHFSDAMLKQIQKISAQLTNPSQNIFSQRQK